MIDSALLRTVLLLAAPFIVPPALKHVQAFLSPSPAGTRTTTKRVERYERVKDSPAVASFRLFVVTLGVSIALFTALSPPHNLFLSLSKPHSFPARVFPILRYPLDLRLATETIHRAWVHHLGRALDDAELSLVQRLQTLDARLGYVAYGAGPVLDCTWCRPGGGTGLGADYLLAILPATILCYLSILSGMGLLLSRGGRERWRVWAVVAVLAGIGNEVWKRLTWEGLGGIASQGHTTVSMLHSRLHVQRSILAALFLLVAYFAPPAPVRIKRDSSTDSSTASVVAPAIHQIVNQSEELLEKLRCLSIERMSILHHDEYRSKVNRFWSTASRESKLARADPAVEALLVGGVGATTRPRRDLQDATREFGEFVERSFVVVGGGSGPARVVAATSGLNRPRQRVRECSSLSEGGGGESGEGEGEGESDNETDKVQFETVQHAG